MKLRLIAMRALLTVFAAGDFESYSLLSRVEGGGAFVLYAAMAICSSDSRFRRKLGGTTGHRLLGTNTGKDCSSDSRFRRKLSGKTGHRSRADPRGLQHDVERAIPSNL